MKLGNDSIGFLIGIVVISVGYGMSILLTGVKTDEERFDKLGTLIMIVGGIIAGAFFSRYISGSTQTSKNSQN